MKTSLLFSLLLAMPFALLAQRPATVPPGGLMQLQVAQAAVDVSSPVQARAEFDPPTAHAGERIFYRVSFDATLGSVQWPTTLQAPKGLTLGDMISGQYIRMQGNKFRPLASYVYEVRAPQEGWFTMPELSVDVSGTLIKVPSATLDVVPKSVGVGVPRRLNVEVSATNAFLGQTLHVRVILPGSHGNEVDAVREIEFKGDGLMTDIIAAQQSVESVDVNGQLLPAYVSDMVVTPIAAGTLKIAVQGFTAGHEFMSPIYFRCPFSFSGGPTKYDLLTSEPVSINVRPLPVDNVLPGFTGAIGKFFRDATRLATNRIHVGEPVQLKVTFHGEGASSRFVPPETPRSREWQIIADNPPSTGFTLVPLVDDLTQTPAIPFSYFDPALGKYVDLSIPPQPVTVVGAGLPSEVPVSNDQDQPAAPFKLSGMAQTPGQTVRTLQPLQLQSWFIVLQLAPAFGFLALWQWDRRRRYLEAHPEIVRRAKARRALKRERQRLQQAAAKGDLSGYVHHAARAMSIAVAPHFPANPQAMVGSDVLVQLDDRVQDARLAETVRKVFAAVNAQFATKPQPQLDLPTLQPEVESVLQKLEEQL